MGRSERSGRSLDWPGGEAVRDTAPPRGQRGCGLMAFHQFIRSRLHQDWLYSRSAMGRFEFGQTMSRYPPRDCQGKGGFWRSLTISSSSSRL